MRDNKRLTGEADAQLLLEYLLGNAARRLSSLEEPVVVAACPNKFDDTGYTQSGTAYKSATPCGTTLITGEREALFSIHRAIPKSC